MNRKRHTDLRYHSLIFAFLCMMFSCGGHSYPPSLLTADSLTEVNPDSAVALLRQLRPQMQQERKAVQMYHRLLTIKAADKADQLQPVADSILPIVKYYESRGEKRLLPTAYYYAGRTYYELHDAPQALDYFQKAAEVAGEDSKLKGCIYSNIGYLFMHHGLYDEAKVSFTEQYDNALGNHDTLDMIYGLRDITIALDSKGDSQGALESIKDAYQLALSFKDLKMIRSTELYLANQYKHLAQYDSALYHAQKVSCYISSSDSSSIYSTLASIYRHLHREDSLRKYIQLMTRVGNIYAKDSAYRYMTELSLMSGKTDEAFQNLKTFFLYDDHLRKMYNTTAVARVKSLYDYQQREKENLLLQQQNKEKTSTLILSCLVSAVVCSYLLFFIISYRKKQEQWKNRLLYLEVLKEKSINHAEDRIRKNLETIGTLEKEIKEYAEKFEENAIELEREKERLLSKNAIEKLGIQKRSEAIEAIKNSQIYLRFVEIGMGSANKASEQDWKDLEKLIDREYDNFSRRIRSLCHLSLQEYRVSLLVKVNIKPKGMSKIMNTSINNISTIRSRAYLHHFGKKGASSDWDEFIVSL